MDIQKRAEDLFDIGFVPAVSIVSGIVLSGVAGQIVPGVATSMLAYKQKRSERMYEKFMLDVKAKQTEFDERLAALSEEQLKWVKDSAFPIVSDYVLENKQEEKIEYLVNGFLNCAAGKIDSDDILLQYYGILDQLSFADLMILKSESRWRDDTYEVNREWVLAGHYAAIKTKLATLGLMETEADKQQEALIKTVASMTEAFKDSRKKFKPERLNTSFLKNYRLTPFAGRFLSFFCDTEK
jgi:hypothetical protein